MGSFCAKENYMDPSLCDVRPCRCQPDQSSRIAALKAELATEKELTRHMLDAHTRNLESIGAEFKSQLALALSQRDRAAEAEREACAKLADEMPWFVETSPKHIRGIKGSDVAIAIRARN